MTDPEPGPLEQAIAASLPPLGAALPTDGTPAGQAEAGDNSDADADADAKPSAEDDATGAKKPAVAKKPKSAPWIIDDAEVSKRILEDGPRVSLVGKANPYLPVGPGKRSKLFDDALLSNGERDELHSEMYTYFKWLHGTLKENKSGHSASQAGMSLTRLQAVVEALEGLRAVGDDVLVLNSVAETLAEKGTPPFLERHCEQELRRRRDETKERCKQRAGKMAKSWDDRYLDLIRHKEMMAGCSYREMNARVHGMGDWLKHQRALYERCDEKFMREKAPRLSAIPGFKWKQPAHVRKQKPKPNPAAMLASMMPPPPAVPPMPAVQPRVNIQSRPPPPGLNISNKYLYQPAVLHLDTNGPPPPPQPPAVETEATTEDKPVAEAMAAVKAAAEAAEELAEKRPRKKRKTAAKKKRRTWEPFDFDTEFENLRTYYEENGHQNPPFASRLGRWIVSLRKNWAQMGGNDDDNGMAALAGAAAAATEAEYVESWVPVSVQAPPGRLGLSVVFEKKEGTKISAAEFAKSEMKMDEYMAIQMGQGARITAVGKACPFLESVRVGDIVIRIDRRFVRKAEDLTAGLDRARILRLYRKTREPTAKPQLLTADQIERLNSIHFNWKGDRTFRSWEESFKDLLEYYKEHGDLKVPRTYKDQKGFRLGEWVHNQRNKYRKKDAKFLKELAPRLEEIGFDWNPQKSLFEQRFKELVEYKKLHGHVDVPCNNSKDNPYQVLGRWVASLRYTKKRLALKETGEIPAIEKKNRGRGGHTCDYLTKQRIQILEDIGFNWDKEEIIYKARLRRAMKTGRTQPFHGDAASEEQGEHDADAEMGDNGMETEEAEHNESEAQEYSEWGQSDQMV